MKKVYSRKCLVCEEKFIPRSNSQWVCSPKCAVADKTEKQKEKIAKIKDKEWQKEKAELKINTHAKEHRKALQNEINKLARMIDAKFGYSCIDCGRGYGKQIDGCHFHSRGANCSLRYNLHNIHAGRSDCNQYSDKHKQGYEAGLKSRYGLNYLEMIDSLPLKYKEVKLSNNEVYEKLKVVRALIRSFDTYQFTNAYLARETLNKIIGIYN